MRLILVLRGYHPSVNPSKIGEFEWSAKHDAYVWQGKELKSAEFNQVVNNVVDSNKDLWAHPVTVRALHDDNLAKARATLAAIRAAARTPDHQNTDAPSTDALPTDSPTH